ncbi:MAG: hypothetical protein DHS20C05_16830 [Hyphococcus sp.]|nr:MAG: hypothetical protein DHS20C05_16830 [Marinicaulis sp.]
MSKPLRLKKILALIAAGFFLATTALAQDPTYLAEYKLYAAAVQNGDDAAAETHARNAWQAAEQELGDHQTTGVLAFNYGRLVIFRDAKEALPALQRAQTLQAAGVSQLPATHLNMLVAFAEFETNGQQKKETLNLRLALKAFDATSAPNAYSAIIWGRLARADLAAKKYNDAITSAENSENAFNAAAPYAYQRKAEAILIQGVARVTPRGRTIESIQWAHHAFVRARQLFPPQSNLDDFDPVLAQVLAWDRAAGAALRSAGKKNYTKHGSNGYHPLNDDDWNLFAANKRGNEFCNIEWVSRARPNYPYRASLRGYIGAVLIGFNLGDDTSAHDARILAEVPTNEFGAVSLEAVKEWRLEQPALAIPVCRNNFLYSYTFVLSD